MSNSNKQEKDIVKRIKGTFSRIRSERNTQSVISPLFVARIKRTVVFGPLGEDALPGIVGIIVKHAHDRWRMKRDKDFSVAEEVIPAIASRAHQLNDKTNG